MKSIKRGYFGVLAGRSYPIPSVIGFLALRRKGIIDIIYMKSLLIRFLGLKYSRY